MNNEPVAWMLNGIIHECDPSDWAKEQYPDQDVIPLYTHPVKEQDTECQYCKQGCIRCDARKQLTDEEIYEVWHDLYERWEEEDTLKFARAILRKAQEK